MNYENRHPLFGVISCGVLIGTLLLVFSRCASAIEIDLERPGDREFVRDLAGLLDVPQVEHIKGLCDKLLTEKATPIIVVTIESMAGHGGEGMRIETFATLLFDQWGIGHAEIGEETWNTGILLLISKNDRKAGIELGGGWGRREDGLCQQIMDEQIIPQFKLGNFPAGILAGVSSLDKMARKLEIPKVPTPMWIYLIWIAFIGLAVFTGISLYRRGASGWAWLFWGVIFTIVGFILMVALKSNSGGSFGGGSFGGGSSGGGGASGSW